jgi:hypothetical protein
MILGLALFLSPSLAGAAEFPPVSQLKPTPGLPDPLEMFNGGKVTTRDEWMSRRRPELIALFQHYMYGKPPAPPAEVKASVERVNRDYFGGKATKQEVVLTIGPPGAPQLTLLLVIPNSPDGPKPTFLSINFCGNHTLLDDPSIAFPTAWMPDHCPGCVDHHSTDKSRGTQKADWAIERTIDRGYAFASFYCGDVDPDRNDFTDGIHPHFPETGKPTRNPHGWGTIAAWAWGMQRAVDHLVTDPDIDKRRIAVVGHSRLGKTSLLAGALDERIALMIPHQAGCGGTAPSRQPGGETVKQINDRFPHWFCDEFKQFNEQVELLPFDQHSLVALCAPRPVLLSNAQEDSWADPKGQFKVLEAADAVYKLLGSKGLADADYPELEKLVDSPLGYYIRPGKHSMTAGDWQVFLDFADKNMPAR